MAERRSKKPPTDADKAMRYMADHLNCRTARVMPILFTRSEEDSYLMLPHPDMATVAPETVRAEPDALRALGDLGNWHSWLSSSHILMPMHTEHADRARRSGDEDAETDAIERASDRAFQFHSTLDQLVMPARAHLAHILDAGQADASHDDAASAAKYLESETAAMKTDIEAGCIRLGIKEPVAMNVFRPSDEIVGPSTGCADPSVGKLLIAYARAMRAAEGRRTNRETFAAHAAEAEAVARDMNPARFEHIPKPVSHFTAHLQAARPDGRRDRGRMPLSRQQTATTLMGQIDQRSTDLFPYSPVPTPITLGIEEDIDEELLRVLGLIAAEYAGYISAAHAAPRHFPISDAEIMPRTRMTRAHEAIYLASAAAFADHLPAENGAVLAIAFVTRDMKRAEKEMLKGIETERRALRRYRRRRSA